jgi:hypothetical protein
MFVSADERHRLCLLIGSRAAPVIVQHRWRAIIPPPLALAEPGKPAQCASTITST